VEFGYNFPSSDDISPIKTLAPAAARNPPRLVSVVCSGAQQMRNENGAGQARLRFTPAFTKAPRGWQRASGRWGHHQKFNVSVRGPFLRKNRVIHKKRVLWKTRNFAGFPAFSHILGIGQWCIVRVLKSAERV
jgi:hypothetical protein